MATLDNDYNTINEGDVSFVSTALRCGAIGGVISVIYALIGILTGFANPAGGFMKVIVFALFAIVISVGIIVYVIREHRNNELGGYISFGRAFLVGLIASLVALVIGTIFNYVYMNFIDPGYVDTILEGMEEMMSGLGLPEEALEEAMEGARGDLSPSKMFTTGLLKSGAVSAVIALIVAAIMKKENPNSI